MATYGMKIYNPDNNSAAYDSTSLGGVFVKFLTLPAGNNTTTVFQEVFTIDYAAGNRTITFYPLTWGDHTWSWFPGSYAGNQLPYLSWQNRKVEPVAAYGPNPGFDSVLARKSTVLMVFAK